MATRSSAACSSQEEPACLPGQQDLLPLGLCSSFPFTLAHLNITAFNMAGLPQWLSSKESVCNTGDTGESGSIPGPGRSPAEGNGNPFIVFLPGKSHGQRNLVGYSPRGSKELDMSERKHSHTQYGDPLGITWRPFLGLISLLSLPGSKTGLRSIPP